jgi:hypothetical protein
MNKVTQTIGQTELLNLLMNIDKSKFNFIVTTTKVRMNKTNNPFFDRVIKRKKLTTLPVVDYNQRVNSMNGTTDFSSVPSTVGVHVSECVIYNEKFDRYYFNYEFFGIDETKIDFTMDDETIERDTFKEFEVKQNYNPNKPKFNSVMLTNIKEISMNNIHYIIE